MPKPVRRKKRFITKKESTTYRLIPGYVEDFNDNQANESEEQLAARKEEEKKYGIFFDDKYNYMKHLRSVNEPAALVNVESFRVEPDDEGSSRAGDSAHFMEFFSTDVKEDDELDPDMLTALEEAPVVKISDLDDADEGETLADFLEDDFILKAGGVAKIVEDDSEDAYSDDVDDKDFSEEENDEDDGPDECVEFSDSDIDEELHSRLQPSQSRGTYQDDIAEAQTALILRNYEEGLGFRCSNRLSDDDEPGTAMDMEHLKEILEDDKISEKPVSWSDVLDDKSEKPKINTSRYLYEDEDEYEWKEVPPSKPKFDCVSILSLNSNTRNRPTDLIPPPKNKDRKKHQKSVGESESSHTSAQVQGLTLKQIEAEMRENRNADRASTFRPSDETAEEKRARKKAIKEERKERRQEKKANRQVFGVEKLKLNKEVAAVSKSVKSVKLT